MTFNYLRRDVPKATIYGHLSKRFAVVEQYINLDSGLKDSDVSVDLKVHSADSGVSVLVGYRNRVHCFYFANIHIHTYSACAGS